MARVQCYVCENNRDPNSLQAYKGDVIFGYGQSAYTDMLPHVDAVRIRVARHDYILSGELNRCNMPDELKAKLRNEIEMLNNIGKIPYFHFQNEFFPTDLSDTFISCPLSLRGQLIKQQENIN